MSDYRIELLNADGALRDAEDYTDRFRAMRARDILVTQLRQSRQLVILRQPPDKARIARIGDITQVRLIEPERVHLTERTMAPNGVTSFATSSEPRRVVDPHADTDRYVRSHRTDYRARAAGESGEHSV